MLGGSFLANLKLWVRNERKGGRLLERRQRQCAGAV